MVEVKTPEDQLSCDTRIPFVMQQGLSRLAAPGPQGETLGGFAKPNVGGLRSMDALLCWRI